MKKKAADILEHIRHYCIDVQETLEHNADDIELITSEKTKQFLKRIRFPQLCLHEPFPVRRIDRTLAGGLPGSDESNYLLAGD